MNTAITFDDISPDYVPIPKLKQLLDLLDRMGIVSTLFVIPDSRGVRLPKGEFVDLLRAAIDMGHEVGLHGYRTPQMNLDIFCPFRCLV